MKSDWNECSLGDALCLTIDHRGLTPKKLGGDWASEGYRALSAKNVKTGRIVQPESIRFVSEDMYQRWMPEEIEYGDILITSEAPFGEIYQWNSDEKIVLSQRLFGVRVSDTFCADYIYYYMTTDAFQGEMHSRATGTTVIGLRQPELLKCKVCYPEIKQQRVIAGILRAIDNKIQLNEEINDNLSDQIQAIYSNEFDPTTHTPTGALADICSYSSDRIPVAELSASTYFSTENMQPNKLGSVDATSLPSISQTTGCHNGDVLVSNIRPYFKKIVYVTDDCCGCSTDVLCFVPKEKQYSAFLFGTLYMDRFFKYMVAGSKGTKMPRGDKKQIMNYPIVLPDKESLALFNDLTVPMLEQIATNRMESSRLASLRDALLPKLMSGELDVSELDL
ncbi:MAG: restriction endonuclease subunit S [Lachnospiraceae bacterium]|nr:restriction endonuclease subunit S [Lachnospiraceae bacterium]